MNQRKKIGLTLFMVVAGAVAVNELVIQNSSQEQNRGVANVGERFQPEQIKWEQELAKTVAQDPSGKILIGKKPNLQEKLLFGALEGKYEASVVNGKLLKIALLPNQTPVTLKTDQLIKQHGSVFKDAQSYEVVNSDAQHENILLKNSQGQEIGKVSIERNDQGRVLNIEIQ
ncbi:hypothetical protein [Pseudobdellovibrio exovorus]|uniref:Uncharacterized protein n=1 Tax=Pseudobdellovibrio exovorus JSS TaxID=1184267 RepID=M4V8Z2_9BACT|nr:hypothetical protein [Pseudobdellovibrio exovorus]AGH95877.1 hypothetical protein A11Q_1661 [Pseudobdellovibrio exovorus JSS]